MLFIINQTDFSCSPHRNQKVCRPWAIKARLTFARPLRFWQPSRSPCGWDVARSLSALLYTCGCSVTQPVVVAGGGWWWWAVGFFFLEPHLTLSGWFMPGGAEAGSNEVTQEDGDDVAGVGISGAFQGARRPHSCIPSTYSQPGSGNWLSRPRPSPTHAGTGNNKQVFFWLLGVSTRRLLFANCSRVLSACAESSSSSPSPSSPVQRNAG